MESKKKQRKTLYWGIKFPQETVDTILNFPQITESLVDKNLIPLKEMHTTLLYVGRKDDPREDDFVKYKNKLCKITVTGHGVSENAIALRVDKMEFTDETIVTEVVPSFATVQHVTVALSSGTKAVDSIKSFSEGTVIEYSEPLVLFGSVWRYFF